MGQSNSNSTSTNYTTTSTRNFADSFNTTTSNMQSLSNLGNVTVSPDGGSSSSPISITIVMAGLGLLFAIVFIFRK